MASGKTWSRRLAVAGGAALAAGATWDRKLMQAEDIALNDPALLPAFFWTDPNIVWPYVEGWRSNGMDKHRSRWISIDQAARIKQFS
jgi:hypothetical protein